MEIFCIDALVKHEVFRIALVCIVHHQFTEQASVSYRQTSNCARRAPRADVLKLSKRRVPQVESNSPDMTLSPAFGSPFVQFIFPIVSRQTSTAKTPS